MRVEEHTTTIEGVPVFYRSAGVGAGAEEPGTAVTRAEAPGTAVTGAEEPVTAVTNVYLHDAITSSEDWVPFLERTGGIAPDLIGFGRSGKGGHLDYTPQGLSDSVARVLAELEVGRISLVGHGWGGALALMLAMADPSRIERLVLIDAVPLLEGFSWRGAARLWRRRLVGELLMGATSKRTLAAQLRRATMQRDVWTGRRLATVWDAFDQGTQRALLRLHRAADERGLAELGSELDTLRMPALVVWGERDPWFAAEFADAYAAALADATVERIPQAGHWPWLDQPRVIDLVAGFLSGR